MEGQVDKKINELIETLRKNNGYIKGYGDTWCRVMTHDHSPVYNVSKKIVDHLLETNALYRDELIIKLNKTL